MIIEIKTNTIIKLLKILENKIPFNGVEIVFSVDKLNHLFENIDPTICFESNDAESNFYKNLAMSIIQYNEKKCIVIDFENEGLPVSQGIFHLLAASFLKKETVFLNIKENNTGVSFIKNKKSIPVLEQIDNASDDLLIGNKIKQNTLSNDFFNIAETYFGEKKHDFFYNKLLNVCNNLNNHNNKGWVNELLKILSEIPENIKSNTEFLKLIFKKEILEKILVHSTPITQFIDFEDAKVKKIIFENENAVITIGKYIIKQEKNKKEAVKEQEERVYGRRIAPEKAQKELENIEEEYSQLTLSYKNEIFSSNYFINDLMNKNKTRDELADIFIDYEGLPVELMGTKEIALNYIRSHTKEKKIPVYILEKIPLKTLLDENFLSDIECQFSHEELFQKLQEKQKKSDTTTKFKISKKYILDNIHKLSREDFCFLLRECNEEFKLNQEIAIQILKENPALYNTNIFKQFYLDIHFLMEVNSILKNKSLPMEVSKDIIQTHMHKQNLNEEEELFVVKMLINNCYFSNQISKKDQSVLSKTNKILRPEILYIHRFKFWGHDQFFIQTIKNIKIKEEFCEFLNNIKNIAELINVNLKNKSEIVNFIYQNMNKNLQNDFDCIVKLIDVYGAKWLNLDKSNLLCFNQNFTQKLLQWGTSENIVLIEKIPISSYFNKEFLLKFSEESQNNPAILDYAPIKVQGFFKLGEHQKENTDFLKDIIQYLELSEISKEKNIEGKGKEAGKIKKI